jgi:hypothetical protein
MITFLLSFLLSEQSGKYTTNYRLSLPAAALTQAGISNNQSPLPAAALAQAGITNH